MENAQCDLTVAMERTTSQHHTTVRFHRVAAGLSVAVASAVAASGALALDFPEPPRPLLPSSAAPLASPSDEPARFRTLREGVSGVDVTALQRELARRRISVVADGDFGPATRRAVRIQQNRFGVRASGVASTGFQQRLGLAPTYKEGAADVPDGARYLREFPLIGEYRYSDDYGAPRPQGGHDGNDIIARKGTPVVAVADGTIQRVTPIETSRGGISVWQLDDEGNSYYFAHLAGIVKGLSAGDQIRAGQRIGSVGNTGDARGGVHHLHFEVHPGDGPSINPYSELRALDPAVDPLSASLSRSGS